MKRTGAVRPGCLVWVALILLAAVFAWKSIDFFILRPAGVKKALNESYDVVRVMRGSTETRKIAFIEAWRELRDTTSNEYVARIVTSPQFDGDTVWVQYVDSLPLPVFGPLVKTFRVERLFV